LLHYARGPWCAVNSECSAVFIANRTAKKLRDYVGADDFAVCLTERTDTFHSVILAEFDRLQQIPS